MTQKPLVLVIDDDPAQETFAIRLSKYNVEAIHVLPDDITPADLDAATLIVIDEYLESWPARERVSDSPGLFVRDGVALAAVLRAYLEGRGPDVGASKPSRTAIVLRTGHLAVLASGLPRYLWPLAVASKYDLEWVLEKHTNPAILAQIADASGALPAVWDPSNPADQLRWLALDNQSWVKEALAQIEQCQPPWSALSSTSSGRLWLSWFMQRVLPFPTFLVDDLRAASYLGLRPSAFNEVLNASTDLSSRLLNTQYTGMLSDFSGRRWWRAGIQEVRRQILDETCGRGPIDTAIRIVELHGSPLDQLNLEYPVFTITDDYETLPDPVEITEAVRLQPDGWPAYADVPWLPTAFISEKQGLAKLVVLDDRLEDGDTADD